MTNYASNPAVALVTGVVPNGNGSGGSFILNLGTTAYNGGVMTTVITGSPTSVTVQLQGTIDGANWSTIATSTSTTGDTQVSFGAHQFNALRANVSALTGGTSPTIAVAISALAVGSLTLISPYPVATLTGAAATTDPVATADLGDVTPSFTFQLVSTGTITAGAVTFYGSVDGVTFIPIINATLTGKTGSGLTLANGVLTFTAAGNALVSGANAGNGLRYFQAAVTTNLVGGGTVTVKVSGA